MQVDWNNIIISVHVQYIKTADKNKKSRTDIKLHPSGYSFYMLYVANYNKLKWLHMHTSVIKLSFGPFLYSLFKF